MERSVQKVASSARAAGHGAASTRLPFVLLAGTQVLLICAITVVTVALPALQRELVLSDSQLALVTSAYGMSFSSLLVLGGRLADRFARRSLLLVGLAVFVTASAAGALAPDVVVLVLARFGQGVGAATAAPAAMAFLPLLYPHPADRSRALARWGGLSGAGAVTGMVLSGLVAQWGSWRWGFVLLVALALPILVAAAAVLPRAAAQIPRRVDIPGAALAVVAVSALCYGILERSGVLAAAGGVVLLVFLVVERRVTHPLVPLTFFGSRRRNLGLAAIVLVSAGMATSLFFLSLHLQRDSGLTPVLTLVFFAPFGLLLVLTAATTGRLLRRHGPGRTLVVGLAGTAAGLVLVTRPVLSLLVLGGAVLPVGIGLAFAAATVLAAADAAEGDTGLVGGLVNTAMELGPTVGLVALVALAASQPGGYGFALGAAAAALVLTAVAVPLLLRSPVR